MQHLSRQDLAALSEVIREAYSSLNFDRFVLHVLSGLHKLIPCELASYDEMNPARHTSANWLAPPDFFTPQQLQIWDRVMHEHPVLMHIKRTGDLRPYKLSDFYSRAELHRRALYNEFYKQAKIEDALCTGLAVKPPTIIGMAAHRDRRNFTERDRLIMDVLRPHLVQAWHNAKAVTHMQHELKLLRQTLERLDRGVVVLGGDGRVRLMTERARQCLAGYFAPGRWLASRLPEDIRRWVREQEAALDRGDVPPPRNPLVIERGDERLVVRLVSGSCECLLFLKEQRTTLEPAALKSLGLSRRETEVLAWLAQGKTNADIACILGVSPRTVQKHLEHIFQKLGVETRTAAAALALEALREGCLAG